MAISPDGSQVAFVESRWGDKADKFRELWLLDIATKTPTRLTFKQSSPSAPAWSLDGSAIYFSDKLGEGDNAKTQVWRINPDGSALTPVTRVKDGISAFQLAADGSAVFYTKHKEHTIEAWAELRKEFKEDVEFGHGIHQVSELWKLDLTTWREEKLVDDTRHIRYFEVSPDLSRIAMITDPDHLLITHEGQSRVDVFNVGSREITTLKDQLWREQGPSPYGWLSDPCWSSDSSNFAFSVNFDGFPAEILVADQSLSTTKLKRPDGVEYNGGLTWMPDQLRARVSRRTSRLRACLCIERRWRLRNLNSGGNRCWRL